MKNKLMTLEQAIGLINDRDSVALGGNVLHRSPLAACREIIRQNKRELRIIKTAGAHDVDLLCAGDCVSEVHAGFISYETEFGLAQHYRKAVQAGKVKGCEHACYTVISALRAGIYNVPFMPVYGLINSDLIDNNDYFSVIEDPFTGLKTTVVKAMQPDIAVIHVQEADQYGNARILGPKYEDILMVKSAKKVIVTSERIVHTNTFQTSPDKTDIPYFLVNAVVHVQGGAKPGTCAKFYDLDRKALTEFKKIESLDELDQMIQQYENKDHSYKKRQVI